eukprot:CAMPEP_0114661362 /NCGR_PEP_ID=MMETSP0191-20121206/22301_1 /TAXON_ID=126664 /ORGANISM="Sorites sp." /LENGTH=311 /DNA_ID=CAMNT_0001893567 /DNA_START=51 /DNA_END=987 /DNA_ORIENTATION=-
MMQAEEATLLESADRQASVGRRRVAVGAVGAVVFLAAVTLVAHFGRGGNAANTTGLVQLSGFDMSNLSPEVQKAMKAAQPEVQKAMQAAAAQAPIDKTLQSLSPKETLDDNNPCADDEELFQSLCYAKCSILSAGMKPVRCAAHICEPLDSNGKHVCQLSQAAINSILSSPSLMPCHGYDVAGTREGKKRCPHAAGACLMDEELYLGTCFKKCSVLTNGQFPHRKAFATCCKSSSLFQCLMPGQAKTDKTFAEGGGFGDHDPDTPAKAHAPMQSLTDPGEDTGGQVTDNVTSNVTHNTGDSEAMSQFGETQ